MKHIRYEFLITHKSGNVWVQLNAETPQEAWNLLETVLDGGREGSHVELMDAWESENEYD